MTLTIRQLFEVSGETPQGDVFAQFGEQAAPAHVGHSSNRYAIKHTADLSPLEKKLREKQRLSRSYLQYRSQHRRDVLQAEPRLKDFTRYLRSIKIGDGEELLDAIRESWLPQAAQPVRLIALELTTRRCDQLNRSVGNEPLDDPLPPEMGGYDDTRTQAARILYPAGRY